MLKKNPFSPNGKKGFFKVLIKILQYDNAIC